MTRTGITVGSVLVAAKVDLRDYIELPHVVDGDPPPAWTVKGEVSPVSMITLPEVFALIRRWVDEGRLDAVRDLTEMRIWT